MFSKQFTGRASAMLATLAAFAAQQREEDETEELPSELVQGRQRAIAEALRVLTPALERLGQAQVSVTLSGSNAEGEATAYSYVLGVQAQPYPEP